MTEGMEGERLARREQTIVPPRGDSPRGGSRDLYQQYLAELAAYPLLDAEAELALARTIEARELEVWEALLSDPARLHRVGAVCAARHALPEGWADFCAQSQRGEARSELRLQMARALRAADDGRTTRRALEQELLACDAGEGRADPYLTQLRRAREGYQAATARMVTANLRLVVSLARRYGAPRLLTAADFVQEGNLGLLRAVEMFDHRQGVRFATYAGWWIRHAFNRALSDRGRLVRVPDSVLQEIQRVTRAHRSWLARHGKAPSADELAAETGLPVDRVESVLAQGVNREPLSIDAETGEQGRPMIERLAAETPDITAQVDAATFDRTVRPLFACLTETEAAVLNMRFGLAGDEPLTLREVGEKYGLTRERIRQLQEKALAKLREALAGTLEIPPAPRALGGAFGLAEL